MLLLCSVKLYMMSTIHGGYYWFENPVDSDTYYLSMGKIFGFIIFGNIIDNVSSPKAMFIFL